MRHVLQIIADMNNDVNEMYLEVKKWNTLYPIYFDKSKSIAQGRKLSKEMCIENPNLEQLIKAACMLELQPYVQPHKAYSRDYMQLGRLKIKLFTQTGTSIHKNVPTKKQLMIKIAKRLSQLRQK